MALSISLSVWSLSAMVHAFLTILLSYLGYAANGQSSSRHQSSQRTPAKTLKVNYKVFLLITIMLSKIPGRGSNAIGHLTVSSFLPLGTQTH